MSKPLFPALPFVSPVEGNYMGSNECASGNRVIKGDWEKEKGAHSGEPMGAIDIAPPLETE